MIKQPLFFLLCLSAMALQSCGKHSDGTSVWAEGLWILPALTITGALIFGILALLSSKSGTTQTNLDYSGDRPGNTKNKGYIIYAVVFVIATIAIIWAVNAAK